ncbi:MAG TPA: hypothetical protein VJB82_05190 [Candidatus Peribacterales bacterium]|nr:hypothetical protein [Candidatus Peribacterales bacterium]
MTPPQEGRTLIERTKTIDDLAGLVEKIRGDDTLVANRLRILSDQDSHDAIQLIREAENLLPGLSSRHPPKKDDGLFAMAFDYIALLTRGNLLSDTELAEHMNNGTTRRSQAEGNLCEDAA